MTMLARRRSGITLTEILIAIMILGVGITAIATLFPLGLLRLRDAARYSRTAYLTQSAASDMEARGLLNKESFFFADALNLKAGDPQWYFAPGTFAAGLPGNYDPFTQDTDFYGGESVLPNPNPPPPVLPAGARSVSLGLPIAYDPLWRFQTVNPGRPYSNYGTYGPNPPPIADAIQGGYYLFDQGAYEARFGSGIGFIRDDVYGNTIDNLPSAHGLQRITNFNRLFYLNPNPPPALLPLMPASANVPDIFVSPEDVVWADNTASNPVSPVLPDLNTSVALAGKLTNDWHYSWMFTGQQTGAPLQAGQGSGLGATFDGNIVIFENRPFGITIPANVPFPPPAGSPFQPYQVDGETVVEAVWGYSTKVAIPGGYADGYGGGADRAVLLRWPNAMNDPVVRVGDWIADITYERRQAVVGGRFLNFTNGVITGGLPNPTNNLEWDDLPAQRAFWYQIQRVVPPVTDPNVANHRSMIVYVNSSLRARTVLDNTGQPVFLNAALISPYIVNVIPQTISVR
jgi:type II secretory pathway pseudopilin PulG